MTLALRWGNSVDTQVESGFVYFDSVTSFTESRRGQVTKHPVDGGGRITDHFIKENSVYTISAVLSAVDISDGILLVMDEENNLPVNIEAILQVPVIGDIGRGGLRKFIPNSIGQFIPETQTEITVQDKRTDPLPFVKSLLTNLVSGKRYNEDTQQLDNYIQTVELYEYDGSTITKIITNLVLTSISIREDVSTGYGIYCDLTLEMVEFVSLRKVAIPQDVVDSLKAQSASKSNKGKQDSTVGTVGEDEDGPQDIDPEREATVN